MAAWQQIVTSHRKLESERQRRAARRQVESAHPALRELAERNANLAEQRQGIAGQITNISSEVTEIDRLLEQLKKDFQRAGERVSKAGHSATVGLMLRKQRDKLPSLRKCDERLRFVGREMPKANLERMELEEERAALGDMESALPLVLSTLDLSNTRTSKPYLEQTARELLTSKRDVLDKLVNDYDTYLGKISELEVGNRGLIDQVRVSPTTSMSMFCGFAVRTGLVSILFRRLAMDLSKLPSSVRGSNSPRPVELTRCGVP